MNKYIIVLLSLAQPLFLSAQQTDTASINKKRLHVFIGSSVVTYGATLVGLNQLWYKNTNQQSFQFFNDNAEWKQIDKIGHFYASFYFSYATSKALRWSNVSPRKADLIGSITGFAILIPIEVLDGFSDAYGASTGDLVADAAGATFYYFQQRIWGDIRISPKFSFSKTRYAAERPNVLGENYLHQIIKDYNGQTYWLSVDADKFINFPNWLNLAIGYGADRMVHAREEQNIQQGYGDQYRQFYFSFDFDLTSIKTRSKVIKTLIFLGNMIKIPAPALEISNHRVKLHAFYF